MDDHRISAVIEAEYRPAPEGTWVPGGEIEIQCVYKVFAAKVNIKSIRKKIKAAIKLYV